MSRWPKPVAFSRHGLRSLILLLFIVLALFAGIGAIVIACTTPQAPVGQYMHPTPDDGF